MGAHKLLTMEPTTGVMAATWEPTTAPLTVAMMEPTTAPTTTVTMDLTMARTTVETTMEVATSQSSLTQPQNSRQSGITPTKTIQSSPERCTKSIGLSTTSRGS